MTSVAFRVMNGQRQMPQKPLKYKAHVNKPPLKDKATLNPEEAAMLYGFSRRKLFRLLKEPNLPFIMCYGKRKLIKRDEFEAYLQKRPKLKKDLLRGEPPKCCKGTEETVQTVENRSVEENGTIKTA